MKSEELDKLKNLLVKPESIQSLKQLTDNIKAYGELVIAMVHNVYKKQNRYGIDD